MRKFLFIFSSIFLLLTLTTFNEQNIKKDTYLFKINKIEIKNVKILDKKKLKNRLYEVLLGSNLFILDEKKIDIISTENELIDYIKFKKIYPSTLQVIIYEKETIAIINYKQDKYYLTKDGEKIKFFNNKILEELPNIFGKQKNFLDIYNALIKISFPTFQIKSFYHFDIGRWDIILKNNKVIKLPTKNFETSLKNFMELKDQINFDNYLIFDYRIKDQLILN